MARAVFFVIAVLFTIALSLPAADQVIVDQWFVGSMNGVPSLQAHAVVTQRADGTSTDVFDMVVLIARKLGNKTVSYESRDSQRFTVDAHGNIQDFRFDHQENEEATVATGHILDHRVMGTILHLGRSETVTLEVPAGESLQGQQAGQKELAARVWKPGDKYTFPQLSLLSDRLLIVNTTATFQRYDQQGHLEFEMLADAMPIPMGMTLTRGGDLVNMHMNMGLFVIDVVPSAGPVALAGVELNPDKIVTAAGPAPGATAQNRYRLPPGAAVAQDEFQQQKGTDVTVSSVADLQSLADAQIYLEREPQLEIDDPAMRAWVDKLVRGHEQVNDKAELLCLAVRSYISEKDLSQGDASALETFRTKRGDCTEHANLLCAALRIAGIPARVEVGLVYVSTMGNWAGHAWNSAYISDGKERGRWVHLDSAYPGIERSCYLKLGTTSGKSWSATGATMISNLTTICGKTIETLP